MRLVGVPLLLGALLAIPASLPMSLTTWVYVLATCGVFALILVGLVVQVRAGVLGLRSRSPAPAVAGTTVAYWSAASLVMVVAGQTYDLVPLLVSAAISGVVVIAVTTAAAALRTRG